MYIKTFGRTDGQLTHLSVGTYNCSLPGDGGHWVSENESVISIKREYISSSGDSVVEVTPVSDGTATITYTCSSYTIHASLVAKDGIIEFIESEVVPLPKELVINPHYWSEQG